MNSKEKHLCISDYNYPLPEDRIAKFPLERREKSKLLLYKGGTIGQSRFEHIRDFLPADSMLVFNNTKVIRARLIFYKTTGARIEIFCLEPHDPADYERAFSAKGKARWSCIVGNLKKWKEGPLDIDFESEGITCRLSARRVPGEPGRRSAAGEPGAEDLGKAAGERNTPGTTGMKNAEAANQGPQEHIIEFTWDADVSFGQLLETLGRTPIPPYLCRESEELDNSRYQTVYSKFEGSVAAPTAGLHFTPELIAGLHADGFTTGEITLHVGAGTFLPVKTGEVTRHTMHTEHFEITLDTLRQLIARSGHVIAVGTTSVRTLESLTALGYRVMRDGHPDTDRPVGQWEIYDIPQEENGGDQPNREESGSGQTAQEENGHGQADRAGGKEVDPSGHPKGSPGNNQSDRGNRQSGGGKVFLEALAGYMEREGLKKIKAATRIMIMPGYRFGVVNGIITNFHQPQSTLLLLVSAFVGEDWKRIYDYALAGGFRFLSYGDSSLLLR